MSTAINNEGDFLYNYADDEMRTMSEYDYRDNRDALLFAIDVSRTMTQISEKLGGISACELALKSIYDCITTRIIENSYNLTGVILYGVGSDKSQCRVLMPLSVPDSTAIKDLRDYLQDADLFRSAFKLSEETSSTKVGDMLFLANQQFDAFASKIPSRRLILITDNDSPEDHAKSLLHAKTRAKDLYHLGIKIEPLFLLHEFNNESFDPNIFYDELIYDTVTEPLDEGFEQLETEVKSRTQPLLASNLSSEILSRRMTRRPLATNTIVLNDQINIGVQTYLLYSQQKTSRTAWIYTQGEVAKTVDVDTRVVVSSTGKDVLQKDVRRTYRFGNEFIKFTPEQLEKFRYFGEPTIRILGFKPTSWLKFDDNIRPNYFVFPTDKKFQGSIRAFSALYQSLMRKEKIAIAYVINKKNSTPFYVALVPSPELPDSPHNASPAGLFMIRLPYADDRRQVPSIPVDQQISAPDNLVAKMRDIIYNLKMSKGYEPHRYNNPSLQFHYRSLQSVALEDEYLGPVSIQDNTEPKFNSIEKRVGEIIGEYKEALSEFLDNNGMENNNNDTQPPAKKPRTSSPVIDMRELWRLYETNTVYKCTMEQLNNIIRRAEVKRSAIQGTAKEILVDSVMKYLKTFSSLDDLEKAIPNEP